MVKFSDVDIDSLLFSERGSAASTPSTNDWRLYFKSGGLFYVDDAGSETQVGTGGGGTDDSELVAGPLPSVDADSILWDGNDLAAGTTLTVSGTQTLTEGSGFLTWVPTSDHTSGDWNAVLFSPSGGISTGDSWRVPVSMLALDQANRTYNMGIVMSDGTTSSDNCVIGHIQKPATTVDALLVGRHGTFTNVGTAPWVSDANIIGQGQFWIQLTYSASNTFQVGFSTNGYHFHDFGESDISKTMTPTHVGVTWAAVDATTTSVDTCIGHFGPLIKAA